MKMIRLNRLLVLVMLCIVGTVSVNATSFISGVKVGGASNSDGASKGKSCAANGGYTVINEDLNYCGRGGWYVYVGYKTSTNPSDAITGLLIVEGQEYQSDDYCEGKTKSITYNGKTYYRAPAEGTADFNAGDGSNTPYLTLFYTKTKSSSTPLFTSLTSTMSTGKSGYVYAPLRKSNAEIETYGSTNYNSHGNSNQYYLIATTHTHSFSYNYDSSYHWHECSCGYTYGKTSHTLKYVDLGDGTHKYWCSTCGYIESTTAHTLTYKDNGDGTHTYWCETCGHVESTDNHTLTYKDNGDGTHSYWCEACGHVESTGNHTLTYKDNGDGTHSYWCETCGHVESTANHTLTYKDNDDGTHSYWCETCRHVESTANHTLTYKDNGDGTHTYWCETCGHVESTANHTLTYKDNGDGTHSYWCETCGHVESTAIHTLTYKSNDDGTHSYWCETCGHVESTGAHTLTYQDKGDGTHKATCSICSYTEVKSHNFTYNATGFGTCGLCGLDGLQPATLSDDDYYEIGNEGQLYWYVNIIKGTNNDGTAQNTWANGRLTADIVVDGYSREWHNFSLWGTFDGNNHTISGLSDDDSELGFCGVNHGTIKNLGILDGYFNWHCGGAICAYNYGTITNCYSDDCIVEGSDGDLGGVTGYNSGTISNCYSTILAKSSDEDGYSKVGGVCGSNNGTVTNCYTTQDPGVGGGTKVTIDQFKSGEVAYLLNNGNTTNPIFRQNLDDDLKAASYPTLSTDQAIVRKLNGQYANNHIYTTATKVGSYYYASLWTDFNYIADQPVYTAYDANSDGVSGTMRMSLANSDKNTVICSEIGVIIRGNAEKVKLTYKNESASVAWSKLTGSDQPDENAEDYGYFVFSKSKGILGFYAYDGTVPAYKAYYVYEPDPMYDTEAKSFRLVFDDDDDVSTGISSVDNGEQTKDDCFNLQGQKVNAPSHGVYIVNGKKVILK